MISDFKVKNKIGRPRFFQKIFAIDNSKFEMIQRIFFLKISNINILCSEKTLKWTSYIINDILLTIKQVQIVDPKELIIVVLNVDSKTFVVHMAIQKRKKRPMHSGKQAQIETEA